MLFRITQSPKEEVHHCLKAVELVFVGEVVDDDLQGLMILLKSKFVVFQCLNGNFKTIFSYREEGFEIELMWSANSLYIKSVIEKEHKNHLV